MRTVWFLSAAIVLVTRFDSPSLAGIDNDSRPPWQRLLASDDAKKASELEKRIAELEAKSRFADAVGLAREMLASRERVQGSDHWQTVDARRKVDTLLLIAAKPAEIQTEWAKNIALEREASALRSKGQFQKAQPLLDKLLEMNLRELGENHPVTVRSYNNVASNLDAMSKHAEAEPLHRKALELCRKLLGEEHPHPHPALCYNNLASNLESLGKHAEADQHYRKALKICRKTYAS